MNRRTAAEVNISVLRRSDKYVQDVVDSATHVAIYVFDEEEHSWVSSH